MLEGQVAVLSYNHNSLEEPALNALNLVSPCIHKLLG